ncbi:probable phosphorylase b kinase regulatory subunit alpha isoform X4 [Haliotis rufescens]|uniref:probable phosphorylase b kinase regulatory subunit alpha isoform X4 n=1 Tax=Haliotis rufescens TaxID=6454 RepID=UPI001EB0534A|nr:probable phosphorylase b kinase regulatory subunit alpha isoform X4 [Haliotis rufescens]
MRNRSNSGIRLDYYQRLVNKSILKYQNPATGLLSASESSSHAWVRDNVYSIMAVWGLALAYRKAADLDEDRSKAYELEQSVVKNMRGLLRCMMMQVDKLERFKKTQNPKDSLHAKFCSKTGKAVVGDHEWGHLQLDATSLFLLTLAQMTATGLQIVYTLDEVAFIQNLVFYIETAYRTPDYGIWERGDKTNHGLPELNSSSIGMTKAALDAINELDLFGARGGPSSIIHVLPDEAQQCQAILHSMMPRESSSKEIDAGLLTVIGYPAFAVDDVELIDHTRRTIQEKLEGRYGCSRFLRDGYKTAKENPNRLHYEPWELRVFENIECQWPIFFAFFILDGLFNNDKQRVEKYRQRLDDVMMKTEDGVPIMPELYYVPGDKVDEEYKKPNSQKRLSGGKIPQMWGQSMYILGRLIYEGFLSPGELDPLNRRLVSDTKPDIVVQVVILCEDTVVQDKLSQQGIELETMKDVAPIQVYPARVLSQIYSLLGKNNRLGLTGRPSSEIGLLATSKLYMLQDQILAFIPQFMDEQRFYVAQDTSFMLDFLRTEIAYLKSSWNSLGRPTITISISHTLLDTFNAPTSALTATIKKLQTGYIHGTRVHLGKLSDFLTTSCVTKLSFVRDLDDPNQCEATVMQFIGNIMSPTCPRPHLLSRTRKGRVRKIQRSQSVHGIVRRSRSIQIDPDQVPEIHAQLESLQPKVSSPSTVSPVNDEVGSRSVNSSVSTSPTSSCNEDLEFRNLHMHLKESRESLHAPPSSSPLGSPQASPTGHRKRLVDTQEEINITELVDTLSQTENLQEQADIIHYLYIQKGPDYDTKIGEDTCTVKQLLTELYEKAGHWKQWWLVRHTAGMLRKRVEDLALAATDLLVRQKQLSVGMPPDREKIITSPLPPEELASIIFDACGEDTSTASLTQELLIYLAMFIRTEPKLLHEMLRLRVGLIIQVMAMELSRTLQCTGEEASDYLLNLSPFEMKTLLHHILSGKEFVISKGSSRWNVGAQIVQMSRKKSSIVSQSDLPLISTAEEDADDSSSDRQGQWMRRRRLDGSLNRVPLEFYPRLWTVLERCQGLSINGHMLLGSLTQEMTPREFKFALQVEKVLNLIPQPEYRQLMVEALMVLILLVENDGHHINMKYVIEVHKLVEDANRLFIKDQKMPPAMVQSSMGAAGICQHLYDSAPSGRFGSMAYLCRALANTMNLPVKSNEDLECAIS